MLNTLTTILLTFAGVVFLVYAVLTSLEKGLGVDEFFVNLTMRMGPGVVHKPRKRIPTIVYTLLGISCIVGAFLVGTKG